MNAPTRKERIDAVVLFGFSPMFVDLARHCSLRGISTTVVCGSRQAKDVASLGLVDIGGVDVKVCDQLDERWLSEALQLKGAAIGCSFGAPYIFRRDVIDRFKGCLLNSHGAPLPEFKGGGGFSWRILQGDSRGASLMHRVSEGVDEGEVVFYRAFEFDAGERCPADFQDRQLREDRSALLPWLLDVIDGQVISKSQSYEALPQPVRSSYFPRLSTDLHAYIDWSWGLADLERFVRAFSYPYGGARTFLNGTGLRLRAIHSTSICQHHPFLRGLITDMSANHVEVASVGGLLRIERREVVADTGSIRLRVGDRFVTPSSCLEHAMASRVVFGPSGMRVVVPAVEESSGWGKHAAP